MVHIPHKKIQFSDRSIEVVRRFEPRTAEWEAGTLPLSHDVTAKSFYRVMIIVFFLAAHPRQCFHFQTKGSIKSSQTQLRSLNLVPSVTFVVSTSSIYSRFCQKNFYQLKHLKTSESNWLLESLGGSASYSSTINWSIVMLIDELIRNLNLKNLVEIIRK